MDNQILLSIVPGCGCFASTRAPPLYRTFTYNPRHITLGHPVLYPFPWQKKHVLLPFQCCCFIFFLRLSFQRAKSNIKRGRKYHYCPSYCDECCRSVNSCTLVKRSSQTRRHHVFLFSWDYYGMKRNALLFCFYFIYLFLRLKFITSRNPSPWVIVSSYIFCFCCLHL